MDTKTKLEHLERKTPEEWEHEWEHVTTDEGSTKLLGHMLLAILCRMDAEHQWQWTIKPRENGWAGTGPGWDGDIHTEVFQYDNKKTEVEAIVEALWYLNSEAGPSTSKYSPQRVEVTIEPGEDYVDPDKPQAGWDETNSRYLYLVNTLKESGDHIADVKAADGALKAAEELVETLRLMRDIP